MLSQLCADWSFPIFLISLLPPFPCCLVFISSSLLSILCQGELIQPKILSLSIFLSFVCQLPLTCSQFQLYCLRVFVLFVGLWNLFSLVLQQHCLIFAEMLLFFMTQIYLVFLLHLSPSTMPCLKLISLPEIFEFRQPKCVADVQVISSFFHLFILWSFTIVLLQAFCPSLSAQLFAHLVISATFSHDQQVFDCVCQDGFFNL